MFDEASEAICHRVQATLDAVEPRFPFYAGTETGEWETTSDGNWCPGHWIGLLWLSASLSERDDGRCRQAALAYTDAAGWNRLRHSLFAGMNYRYAGFRGGDVSGDTLLTGLGLRGAAHVRACFDEAAAVVPVGAFGTRGLERHGVTDGSTVAAVDALYTAIGPLWRAASVTGDDRYLRVARRHADTHCRWFVREDGSVWHKASFDPATGALGARYNQLTRVEDGCWARGLGWSIAGLADAYNATRDADYLVALERHVDYYDRWSPDDDVPFAELGHGAPEDHRDTSGAALTAYGLVRLAGEDLRAVTLREYGHGVLRSLVENYLVVDGPLRGQLRAGCYNAVDDVATNHELVWSTYYLLAALVSERSDRFP